MFFLMAQPRLYGMGVTKIGGARHPVRAVAVQQKNAGWQSRRAVASSPINALFSIALH